MALDADSQELANLHAFARLYGVVRWFHPSDAAAATDWDQLAIAGARRVRGAADAAALRAALGELFAPIAPTMHIAAVGEAFPDEPALHPAGADGLDVVAWEHEGFGDSAVPGVYASKRRHRDRTVATAGMPFASLSQAVDATPYRGMRVRLRGKLRTDTQGHARLWVRVDRTGSHGFFDNMIDRPVATMDWTSAEIVGAVDADATQIVFGTLTMGHGTAWYDDLELSMQNADGSWTALQIEDPGFEAADLTASWKPGVGKSAMASSEGWTTTLDHDRPASGGASLRVAQETHVVSDELFAEGPKAGETVDIDLGSGLRARVPLALYSKDGHTIGDHATKPVQTALPGPPGYDPIAGVADVIVVWNVLQHFWPYWQDVSVNWNAELDTALRAALRDGNMQDHMTTLRRLSAAAADGHADVSCPGLARRAKPPFTVDVIEGQLVVTATADPAVVRGDVVLSLDGQPAQSVLADGEALASGSPQWRRERARRQFGNGTPGSTMALRVRRDGAERDLTVVRNDKAADELVHPAIERLDDGVYYVDLSRASNEEIAAAMDRLAAAPGVVFDLRGYPNGTHPVLFHLLTRPDDFTTWMSIPHIIRPDHGAGSIAAWNSLGWEMPVQQPHIAGRVAFLTGPGAISYAESVMGLVDHYHLGEIVGSTTAGTNGNVAQIEEPTGCSTYFTGLRVSKTAGARFHLLGVQPTIPASRTLAGVIAGRDEVLEKALAYIRTGAR